MGVDAKAVLTGVSDPIRIASYLEKTMYAKNVRIQISGMDDFCYIIFNWKGEDRQLSVFYNGNCKCDYQMIYPHNAVYVSLGKWGMSDAIIMTLANKFGGFYCLDDCADEWSSVE